MTSQSSRRDGADDMTTDEMELGDKAAQEIDLDLQTVPMQHIETSICNIPKSSKIKQEPDCHINVDVAKFSEPPNYSGNVANLIGIQTEVNGGNDYHSGNLNNTYGPTYTDHNIADQILGMTVAAIKPEPEDETNVTNEAVIEIDTCKDEYYEQYGYPTNCINVNLRDPAICGAVCVIDTRPCSVRISDIQNTYPHITTQRSVQIHEPGSTRVIDGPPEASVTDLTRRAESIRTNKTHVCKVCGAVFRDTWSLTRHTLIHTGVKPYTCSDCGVGFTHKGNLKTHTRIHTGEKPHKCAVCAVSFARKDTLATHMRKHTGEKPHQCSVCKISLADSSCLTRHMRIHTGEKPYKCPVCGAVFTQKHALKMHTRMHTGEKPHKCSVCEVSFSHKHTLTSHMRTHTGEKPYKCPVCGVGFVQKSNLTTHMRIHTGEKPYICSVCGVAFRHHNGLKQHKSSQCHAREKPHT